MEWGHSHKDRLFKSLCSSRWTSSSKSQTKEKKKKWGGVVKRFFVEKERKRKKGCNCNTVLNEMFLCQDTNDTTLFPGRSSESKIHHITRCTQRVKCTTACTGDSHLKPTHLDYFKGAGLFIIWKAWLTCSIKIT